MYYIFIKYSMFGRHLQVGRILAYYVLHEKLLKLVHRGQQH